MTRRRCYEYWKQPDGGLVCYICKRHFSLAEVKQTKPPLWDAEHDLARNLGGSDLPPNVKPACRPTCEGHDYGHAEKTKQDVKSYAKHRRINDKEMGFSRGRGPKVKGSKGSGWRKKWDKWKGRWVWVRESDLKR